jgi:hypothetical protein
VTRRQRRLLAVVLLLTLAALAQSAGCVRSRPVVNRDAMLWDRESTFDNAAAWRREAAKRLNDPFVFICHGEDIDGQWSVFPNEGRAKGDMDVLAQCLRDLIPPERDILLVACNPHGHTLHVRGRGVYYAKRSVWVRPGPDFWMTHGGRWLNCAGDIGDFVEAGPKPTIHLRPSTQPTTQPTTGPTR